MSESINSTEPKTPSYTTSNHPTSDTKHRLETPSEELERPSKLAKIEQVPDEEGEREGEEIEGTVMKPGTQRYLIAIEYIGTRFSGSQQQVTQRTVTSVLHEAFRKFVGQPVSIFCSSRTDSGVHALSNVCHVDIQRISKHKPGEVLQPHDPSTVRKAVNHFLLVKCFRAGYGVDVNLVDCLQKEGDVSIVDVRCVPSDFHARYKAQERTYYYRLLSGPESLSTFEKDRAWHVPEDLDLQAMQEACNILVGQHDFSSFRGSGCQANSPIRTLDELQVHESTSSPYFLSFPMPSASDVSIDSKDVGKNATNPCLGFGVRRGHRCFIVKARARSFLYHQVRLLVGVLKCVGAGNLTLSDVERILNAKNVLAASPMAPSCGLYLGHVKYDLD